MSVELNIVAICKSELDYLVMIRSGEGGGEGLSTDGRLQATHTAQQLKLLYDSLWVPGSALIVDSGVLQAQETAMVVGAILQIARISWPDIPRTQAEDIDVPSILEHIIGRNGYSTLVVVGLFDEMVALPEHLHPKVHGLAFAPKKGSAFVYNSKGYFFALR